MGKGESDTALPELERLLVRTAAAQSSRAAASSTSSPRGLLRGFAARRSTRLAALGVAVALCGGSAMAAIGVWDPPIGVIAGGAPPQTSETPVPTAITDAFGILRRAQTAKDRSPEVEETLSRAAYADGVRLGSVRYLAPSEVEGMAAVLFAVRRPNPVPGEPREQLCLYRPAFRHPMGELPSCWGFEVVLAGRAYTTFETVFPSGHRKNTVVGLVPDGVATVTAKFSGAPDVTVPVHENYFELLLHGAEITHRPGSVRRTVWRDAEGHVVPQLRLY